MTWLELFVSRWRRRQELEVLPLDATPRAVEALLLSAWSENLRGLDRIAHRYGRDVGRERLRPALVEEVIGVAEPSQERSSTTSDPSVERPSEASPRLPKPDADGLREALVESDWNVRAVARAFGRDRRQVYRWMESYGIERPSDG